MIAEKKLTKPEDEQEEKGEILDFTNPSFKFIPKGLHTWRQQGPYIVCKSCELDHAIYIGVNKRLIGFTDKGEPIVQKVKV